MKKFSKSERSSFRYWICHWMAFNMTAIMLHHWRLRYLFHDWYKPWMKMLGIPYKTIQKFHRSHSSHHLEYNGWRRKDYYAMMIDWECSRFTKESCPLNAAQELIRKRVDTKRSLDGVKILSALRELDLIKNSIDNPDRYVYLREDSFGDRYIESVFYDSSIHHGYSLTKSSNDKIINSIYLLSKSNKDDEYWELIDCDIN